MSAVRAWQVDHNGETCFIKYEAVKKTRAIVYVQRIFSTLLRMPMLRPTYGQGTLERERARLDDFRKHHILVPEIRAVQADHMILSYIGLNLTKVLDTLNASERYALIARALMHLQTVHANGLVHGRPLLKDMTLSSSDAIGMLDFEENPLDVMPQESARARDVFLFFCSAGRYLSADDLARLAQNITWTGVAKNELRRLMGVLYPFARLVGIIRLREGNEVLGICRAVIVLRKISV